MNALAASSQAPEAGPSRTAWAEGDGVLDLVGFGSIVLDRMHRAARILGPNEKGLLDSFAGGAPVESVIGGLMLNQLGWASLFGIRTGLFGRLAEDESGALLQGAMAQSGIETHLDLTGSASALAEIFIDREGERAIYMAAGATAETRPEHVRDDHADFIARGRRLTTEVSQLPLDTTLAALRIAHAAGLETVLDFDILPSDAVANLGSQADLEEILQETDILKPTAPVARALVPGASQLEDAARRLREDFGSRVVVMTDGERGAVLCDETGERRIPAFQVATVNDSTGAGDAFMGGFLAADALGCSADESTRVGHACGAACVEQLGAFPENREGLLDRIENFLGEKIPQRV